MCVVPRGRGRGAGESSGERGSGGAGGTIHPLTCAASLLPEPPQAGGVLDLLMAAPAAAGGATKKVRMLWAYEPVAGTNNQLRAAAGANPHALVAVRGHIAGRVPSVTRVARPLCAGEVLDLLQGANSDWWRCRNAQGGSGWVPANYAKMLPQTGATAVRRPGFRIRGAYHWS